MYPRDALPARVLAMSLCLCVCPFVKRRYCVKTAERIRLVSGTKASLGLCYTVTVL